MEILSAFLAGILCTIFVAWLLRKWLLQPATLAAAERQKFLEAECRKLQEINTILGKEKLEVSAGKARAEGLLENSRQRIGVLELELVQQAREAGKAREELADSRARLQAAAEKLSLQKLELEEVNTRFRLEFRELANAIMDEKTRKFTEVNEEKMKSILDPLKLNLAEFRKKVEETYDKESKQRFSLEKELNRLMDLNKQLSDDTSNLTNALKYNNKVQGNWGEMILESLLAHSGLTKGREYLAQEFLRDRAGNIIKDEDGRGLQPDVMIVYPDDRKVIIDSKMSLIAFEKYVGAGTREEELQSLKDHLRSIRQHIDGLSRKQYPKYAGASLDYVILFIPVEPAFILAVKEDPQLWKYAYDRRILLVSPTNLLAILKIIADLWKVELQSRNAIEIAARAGVLYDKFVLFTESMECIGAGLQKANDAYQTARKRLSEGPGNLVRQAEQMKVMGAKASKQLPVTLLDAEPVTGDCPES